MEIFAELVLDRVILRSMRNLKSQNNCRKMINKLSVKFRLLRGSQLEFKMAVVCSHFAGLFVFEIGKKKPLTRNKTVG